MISPIHNFNPVIDARRRYEQRFKALKDVADLQDKKLKLYAD